MWNNYPYDSMNAIIFGFQTFIQNWLNAKMLGIQWNFPLFQNIKVSLAIHWYDWISSEHVLCIENSKSFYSFHWKWEKI